ncbi:hypothetical protein VOLCADRAFT_88788 [Volvox carteri f. nagariensis]|uniref:Uncharacterized protein n=1 Tax=Volvox carteri f. nagariensis TaxID=3068 RepID=D8TPY4_VOLCA|nr:uncharacterized protein VOLCADRAFT_88788 [Volvox carteri f. nagariensis]EFJ50441.1 hypothetical protein VOLCADRAFT_88788 [Volvox carteri f. nagariensis]|eukprot:XP_002948566.1 hypothetical protein VOLCADRAFT_88788 [Volvox carteri f. nagariensis]
MLYTSGPNRYTDLYLQKRQIGQHLKREMFNFACELAQCRAGETFIVIVDGVEWVATVPRRTKPDDIVSMRFSAVVEGTEEGGDSATVQLPPPAPEDACGGEAAVLPSPSAAGPAAMPGPWHTVGRQMRAAALTIGWPPLFFTVNPADMHAACAVVASGQVLDFDDDGRPQHIPSTVEKWRRVKDDPYSCAALLVATKEVLVEELFGFAPGAMQQTNPRCFCGLTFEVAVKVEQSGCLALHIHGVAHVATFAVERLQALFSGPNCRALALAYALCAMWYPSPYYDPFTRGAEHYIMDMTVEEAQQHGRAPPPVDKSCPPAAYDFGRLAGCAAAALAFGCNQLFTLACEVDRVYTAEAAAQLARPEDERGDCVLLQPAADRARDSAYYSTKYTGKRINDSQAQLTCNALTRVQDFLLAGRTPNPGASGPTAFGNMCATVHRMTAAITAGMALVAMKLDGHSTFEATFECAYLQVDAFTALSAGADQSPEVATTAAVLVEAEEQEGYTVTNAVHNYVLRGEELSGLDCSVYNLSSNYEVRRVPPAQHPHRERLGLQSPVAVRRRKRTTPATPITAPVPAPVPLLTAAPATPPEPPAPTAAATLDQPTSQTATELPRLVAFHGTHPLYRTHVHIRLPRPRYVQLGGSLPRRPRPGTSAAGMAQYYAFVLGTFKAHRGQPIPPGLSVKEAYDTWWAELGTTEAGRSYQAYVTVLLDNIEEDHAGKARRQAEYNQRRRQQRAAAAAAALPEGDSTSASDGDTDDGIRGHLRPDPETQLPAEDQLEHFVYIPGQEYPTAGTDLAAVALTDLFDCTNAAGVYAYDAARRCRAPALADGHGAGSDRFSRRITPADLPLLTEAAKRLKWYLVAAAAGTVEADGGAHAGLTATPEMDTPHVELHRPTSRPLVAIVRMPGTPERTEQARMPLYVHLPQPPSIDDTIELFTLAPHQAVPFMLMARYFDRRDEPNPGDPPQMLVEGKPGTGKSQFVQVLLWYTFQHGCPHWAATCAYSWAAATAFSTPVHRSLSTHAMFALSAGSNRADSVRKGSAASLQVHRNVGDGALIIDEIGMNSLDHLGACNQSCTRHLLPPPHLAGDHPAATIFSGRPSANTGDEFQHPKPGGPPLYRYAAAVECNPQFSPSVPTAQPLHGEEANDGDPNEAAAGSQGGQQQPEAAARRPRAVPQTQSCILEGFRVYRSLAKTVFLLEKQQRQDSSPSGRRLTEYASMFGGEPATEQRIAEMVDDLNSRAIVDLADLAHLEPRVVLQRNEPRHTLNTRLIMLEAQRKNQRLVVWNADHVPVQKRGAAVEPALTHVEKAVAMRIKDHEFGHTTADTWYYHGARYILLDTTAADAGASHNNEVEACGLLEDGREPADDGRGPYRRLKYLPAAVIVRPISGHIPGTVLQGLGDYASRGGAFILSPRASCIAEVEMPAAGYGTITKQIRRLNVPLGDRQAVTDYFVQGRSFKDECWLVDLAVPPNGIKRATLYVLLTRFKTLDHVRLLRPLYTTPHERKRIIKQFLSVTNLEPDLAANLRLLKQAARETEQRYTAEFEHARQLEARWTRPEWGAAHQCVEPPAGSTPARALHRIDPRARLRNLLCVSVSADAGASHNNEVEACGLLEDGREPADDGRGPYRRLKYLPAAVIVRPISGHIPGTVLQGLGDYASRGGAFILSPRASCIAEVEMPAAGYGTITKQIRRLNVPLGDRQAVTDYFVQGRSFKDECWLVDLAVPPNGIKRATLYVLLTRFKTLDHVRLLRPLYTTPHERKRIIKQFLSVTNLEPDLAANLRLLKQAARETEQRYTAEFEHARQLEARWTRPVQD